MTEEASGKKGVVYNLNCFIHESEDLPVSVPVHIKSACVPRVGEWFELRREVDISTPEQVQWHKVVDVVYMTDFREEETGHTGDVRGIIVHLGPESSSERPRTWMDNW